MKVAKAKLKGISPYSQSRYHDTPKKEKEQNDDYRDRTWREHLHYDKKTGEVFIPPMSFKNCIAECAKYLSKQIPGKGKSTYTKHFEAGVLVVDPVKLGITKDNVDCESLFLPSDGVRGSGKRVMKKYPVIHNWSAVVNFMIFDEVITEEVFRQHLEECGKFIGIGRFRPRNNGFYGRFEVVDFEWVDD